MAKKQRGLLLVKRGVFPGKLAEFFSLCRRKHQREI
jgi:hypothetical protein